MKRWFGLFSLLFISSVAMAGTIVVSVSSLFSFGNCPVYFASDVQRYTASGSALSAPINITAPEHFEISLNYTSGYSNTLQLNPISGTVAATTIYVRFSPYNTGSKSGNITHVSSGSASQNVALSGTATATPATGTNAATYYSSISSSATGSSLKTALYTKILGHSVTSYSGLWATYSTTDALYNGKVWDIYSTRLDANSPYEYTFSTNQCGSYAVEGDCYNREHSFPQSWFASASPMVSDMYHIYPTDGKVNGMRNNYPHGEVSSPTFTGLQGGKLGPNTTAGYSGTTFEPINDYKGDLARSFFYMSTRYENLIAGWQTNGNADDVLAGNAFPAYDAWFLAVLIKWHNQDPPSVKEINRNNSVYGYQGNRNPFIDSPQYVNRIWGGAAAVEPATASSSFVLKSNTLNSALISWKTGAGQKRLVIARAGSAVNALPVDGQGYQASPVFGSGSQLGSGNYVVYNGMGSSIDVSGLNQNLVYYFLVVEYNGSGNAINYLTTTSLASGGIALPVEWLSFEGNQSAPNQVDLHWSTASESNNASFDIERLMENGRFESIGKVQAKGNSQQICHYYFSDNQLQNISANTHVITYRLKQTDLDGRFSFSKELNIELRNFADLGLEVVNPVGTQIEIKSQYENVPAQIIITDLNGKIIFETQTRLQAQTFIDFNPDAGAGMYFLHILQRAGQQTFKIIKG